MKAAVYKKYGKPDVVYIAELPIPKPAENEVLIKVIASTVNRTDAGFRSAEYFISRFWSGLFRPKYPTLGCEFSGVITQIGEKVSEFKVGDEVFGFNDQKFGGHAEYMVLSEKDAIAIKPANLSFQQAACLTEGAHYALCDIRAAKLQSGQEVMVYGATGAIGTAAVQILKYFGMKVTAVCNTKNIGLIKSLGADVVIDYQTEDYTIEKNKYAFIFDAVGKSSFKICKPLLTEKGVYISTEFGENGINILLALTTPLGSGRKLLFPLPSITKADVLFIKELAEKNLFKPVLDKHYPLEQIVEAYQYVETGQKTGNVILQIGVTTN